MPERGLTTTTASTAAISSSLAPSYEPPSPAPPALATARLLDLISSRTSSAFRGGLTIVLVLTSFTLNLYGQMTVDAEAAPVLVMTEIRALDADAALFSGRTSGLVELQDGTVLVGAGAHLAVFSPDGKYVGDIGGEGEGPGEYRRIAGLGVHGDTVWVGDVVLGRGTRLLADGTLVETISLPPEMRYYHPRLGLMGRLSGPLLRSWEWFWERTTRSSCARTGCVWIG